jgi:hypothetical protein
VSGEETAFRSCRFLRLPLNRSKVSSRRSLTIGPRVGVTGERREVDLNGLVELASF